MTDRELLELAAKAAGIKRLHVWGTKGAESYADLDKPTGNRWNPLTDDGDALRLAVKLNIHICRYSSMTTARILFRVDGFDERDDGSPCAATRRAIVRAAAEIGRSLP